MKLATTTGDFGNYANTLEEIVEIMAQTSFRCIDCGLGAAVFDKNPELRQDNWLDAAKRLKECAEKHGMQFVQAHAPMGRPLVKDDKYEEFLFLTKRSMEIAAALGIPNIVVHSGYREGISKEQCFQENKLFYDELLHLAEEININVLTENFNKMCVPNMYWMDNAPDERELIDLVNHPLFHACWDTGHGNMQELSQYDALSILGEHVYALHVQDNLGNDDHHMAPFMGTLDADSLMRGLTKIGYKGYFTFEATRMIMSSQSRRQTVENGPKAKLPLSLKIKAENLLYEIGEFMIQDYTVG